MRVLIVDDEFFVSSGLREKIPWNRLGINFVETADDGINALKKAKDNMPDILVTDIRMPRMDGIELALKIRDMNPLCKIIFLTAYSDKEYLKSAIDLQAFSYIEKPINLSAITVKLKEAVASLQSDEVGLSLMEDKIVSELLKSDCDIGSINSWLKKIKLPMSPDGSFAVITAYFKEPSGEPVKKYIEDSLGSVLGSAKERPAVLSAAEGGSTVVIVFGGSDHTLSPKICEQVCQKALDASKVKKSMFLSAGNIVRGIEKISDSYKSSIAGLDSLFYNGFGGYAMPGRLVQSSRAIPEEAYLSKLDGFLEGRKQSDAIILIKTISNFLRQEKHRPVSSVRNFYSRMIMSVVSRAGKINIKLLPDGCSDYSSYINSGKNTLSDLTAYVIEGVKNYFDKMDSYLSGNTIVADIYKIVSEEYASNDLSITYVSDRLHLSRNHISTVFKDETGKTIHEYITEFRLDKAKKLLGSREGRLSEIAKSVGFRDHNYFTKVFRKAFGITPSDYRRKHRI